MTGSGWYASSALPTPVQYAGIRPQPWTEELVRRAARLSNVYDLSARGMREQTARFVWSRPSDPQGSQHSAVSLLKRFSANSRTARAVDLP